MGKHRTRQSNSIEYCPVCSMCLTNRASASSHYGKHVRAGELIKRMEGEGAEYRLVTDNVMHSAWWRMGFHAYGVLDKTNEEVMELERKSYLVKQWKKENGLLR